MLKCCSLVPRPDSWDEMELWNYGGCGIDVDITEVRIRYRSGSRLPSASLTLISLQPLAAAEAFTRITTVDRGSCFTARGALGAEAALETSIKVETISCLARYSSQGLR